MGFASQAYNINGYTLQNKSKIPIKLLIYEKDFEDKYLHVIPNIHLIYI